MLGNTRSGKTSMAYRLTALKGNDTEKEVQCW